MSKRRFFVLTVIFYALHNCIAQLINLPLYATKTERVSLATSPMANSNIPGQSVYDYNYNAAYAALRDADGLPYADALFIRVQDMQSAYHIYDVKPSQIALVESASNDRFFSDLDNLSLQPVTYESVIINSTDGGLAESYGAEDPRVSYRPLNKLYYLFYTAAEILNGTITARLVLATSPTPPIRASWFRHGPVLVGQTLYGQSNKTHKSVDLSASEAAIAQYRKYHQLKKKSTWNEEEWRSTTTFGTIGWSKSGAVLWRDEFDELPILFWGEGGVYFSIATSMEGYQYQTFSEFLFPRRGYFDSDLTESGPSPAKLSDGNYFFLYNSAQNGYPSTKPGWDRIYRPGYVILDGKNPYNILQRSDSPLIVPQTPYEVGTMGYPALSPITIFVEGMKQLANDKFLLFYGCSDGTLAAATVQVSRIVDANPGSASYDVFTEYE